MQAQGEALDIYSYLDYRSFCRDFYSQKKASQKDFSFRSFARKAQVAGSYLKHVIDGTRNLSPEMGAKFAAGMDLDPKEIDYFETLIRFSQASSIEEKTLYLDRLRRKKARALRPLGLADAVNLLSHWYVVAIKELVVNLNSIDSRLLSRVLRKKVSEGVIEKTVAELIKLGWLFEREGRWSSQATQIQFPDEVRSYVIRSFHRQMLELGSEALDDELEEREFGAAVFTFPKSEFPKLKAKLKDLQVEFVSYVQDLSSQRADEEALVYYFGMQCFSLQKSLDLPQKKELHS